MEITRVDKLYNAPAVMDALIVAGIALKTVEADQINGDWNIRVTYDDPLDTTAINAILDAHDSSVPSIVERISAVQAAAKVQAENIPEWATYTESEALIYIDTNMIDLASAKIIIKALARMVIALRNERWPDLQG